jgi:membrane protein
MASIKDVPKVFHKMGVMGFGKKLLAEINQDEVFTWGSALAYAWIFAIFPFLIFLLTLAPYLPGSAKQKVMDQVSHVSESSMGGQGGQALAKSVSEVMSHHQGGLLSFGLILALWGASGGMSMTMSALDKAYYVTCSRSFIKQRLIAIGLTIAAAILILVVVLLLPIGTAILSHLNLGMFGTILINITRYIVAIGLLLIIVAMIYYFGPCVKKKWQSITPGAVFTVVVWLVLGFCFAFYVTHFGNFNATYGALGGAIIMLLFFYINAVVLVIGAEINSIIDFETLDVKQGATDLTQAKAKAEYDEADAKQQGEKAPRPEPQPALDDEVEEPEPSHAGRRILIGFTSLMALRWTWKRIWAARAKRIVKERAKARHKPWFWFAHRA